MKPVVIDASALLAWLLGDNPPTAALFDAVLRRATDAPLLAPTLMRLEVANALAMALRQAELGDSKPSRSSKERIAESDWRRVAPEFWTTLKRAIGDSIGGNS